MHGPLLDLAKDLAVARALDGAPDPSRTMRRRIAALLGIPALVASAAVGSAIPSWIAGVSLAVVLFAALWLFAEGVPRRLSRSNPS